MVFPGSFPRCNRSMSQRIELIQMKMECAQTGCFDIYTKGDKIRRICIP